MRLRAFVHIGGPPQSGKTTFVEAVLGEVDAVALVARCVRDGAAKRRRETAPKAHPELRRYRQAGASGVAVFRFAGDWYAHDDFFTTDLMNEYSEVVLVEGDNPLQHVDLSVFVAPGPVGGVQPSCHGARLEADIGERDGAGTRAVPTARDEASPLVSLEVETRDHDGNADHRPCRRRLSLVLEHLQEPRQLFADVVRVDGDLVDQDFEGLSGHRSHRRWRASCQELVCTVSHRPLVTTTSVDICLRPALRWCVCRPSVMRAGRSMRRWHMRDDTAGR